MSGYDIQFLWFTKRCENYVTIHLTRKYGNGKLLVLKD